MQKELSELYNLINIKNLDKAYSEAKRLYRLDKDNTEIIKILAFLHLQRGQFESVISLLEEHYSKNPQKKDFDFYANMGASLKSLEEYKRALEMYEKAKEINSESSLCYSVPAEIKLKQREFDEAINLIDMAINKIRSGKDQNALRLMNVIKLKTEINVALNKDEENGEMLLEILSKKFHPDIFYLIANINVNLIDKNIIAKAEEQLKVNESIFKNKLDRFWHVHPIYFGLAIYYQKFDQLKSENFYHLGNKETMQSLRYNSFDYQKSIGGIIECYNNFFSNLSELDNNFGLNNFFILGTPRSGTTLIESFISSNNEVRSAGELTSANKLIDKFVNDTNNQDYRTFIDEFRKTYLGRTDFLRGEFNYVVDKLPENFLCMGILMKLLPKSKIIRTFRDPWDVAVSLYKQRYVTNIPFSASFFNIGVFMANFEAINNFWSESLKDKSNLMDIKYEDLVDDPSTYQKKIYSFLEIKSDFNEDKRRSFFSQTASIRQIGSPVHKKSIRKQEFLENKQEFYEALQMQRLYWQKRGNVSNSGDFFGYKLG